MNLNIYSISTLLSKQQILSNGLFRDNKKANSSRYWELFEMIKDGQISNDEEAIQHFKYSNAASFRKFKGRYTDKLLNYLILSDTRSEDLDEVNEEYFRLLKYFAAARVLHYNLLKKESIKLYKYIYSQAKKYGIYDLALLACLPIRGHYAFVEPKKHLYLHYHQAAELMTHNFEKRLELDEIYDDLSHQNTFVANSNKESFHEEIQKRSEQLLDKIEETDYVQYITKVLEIASFSATLSGDYHKAIEVGKRAAKTHKNNPTGTGRRLIVAYRDILLAFLKLGDYENAKIYMDKMLKFKLKPGHNLYRHKGLEFALYAITQDYYRLHSIVKDVTSYKHLKTMKMQKEEWTIREAFVHVLIDAGKIDQSKVKQPLRKFRINRFINEVELFAKDKRGMNIAIQVVQLMHYLMRKEYHKIIDRLDALNQYTYRYLRNDESLRSNCFIKMLLKLPDAEYHPIRTKRYVARYEKKLLETPYEVSLKDVSVEIIPYEYLWEIIMETLERNQKKRS